MDKKKNLIAFAYDRHANLWRVLFTHRRGWKRPKQSYIHRKLEQIVIRLRYTIGVAVDRRYDRRHGVDTCGMISAGNVPTDSTSHSSGNEYKPSPVKALRVMFSHVLGDLQDYTFLDYGCGKGRALLVAAELPFRRVIGIEYSGPLAEIAKANLSTFKNGVLRCEEIEVLHLDAMSFDPRSDPTVYLFFSPFRNPVLQSVLDRITAAYYRSPHAIVILYSEDVGTTPIPADQLNSTGFLYKVDVPSLPFDIGAPHPCEYEMWASPEALAQKTVENSELRHN